MHLNTPPASNCLVTWRWATMQCNSNMTQCNVLRHLCSATCTAEEISGAVCAGLCDVKCIAKQCAVNQKSCQWQSNTDEFLLSVDGWQMAWMFRWLYSYVALKKYSLFVFMKCSSFFRQIFVAWFIWRVWFRLLWYNNFKYLFCQSLQIVIIILYM